MDRQPPEHPAAQDSTDGNEDRPHRHGILDSICRLQCPPNHNVSGAERPAHTQHLPTKSQRMLNAKIPRRPGDCPTATRAPGGAGFNRWNEDRPHRHRILDSYVASSVHKSAMSAVLSALRPTSHSECRTQKTPRRPAGHPNRQPPGPPGGAIFFFFFFKKFLNLLLWMRKTQCMRCRAPCASCSTYPHTQAPTEMQPCNAKRKTHNALYLNSGSHQRRKAKD
jgi:hypothetical protein